MIFYKYDKLKKIDFHSPTTTRWTNVTQQLSKSTNLALRLFKAGESISIKAPNFTLNSMVCEIQNVAMEALHACVVTGTIFSNYIA